MLYAFIRTCIVYILLIGVIRLMGKRQIGQLEPSEFVVTMLVANLASIPLEDETIPLIAGVIPVLTVLAMEFILSVGILRSIRLRKLLCGKPMILIDNGKLLQRNLRRSRLTLDELMGQLRLNNVLQVQQVRFAILETNGSLSVFPFPDAGSAESIPVTIIQDGYLFQDDLKRIGKNEKWLEKVLKKEKATQEETLLLTLNHKDETYFVRKDGKSK